MSFVARAATGKREGAARLLTMARVSPKAISQLTERQRGRLIVLLSSQHRAMI